MKPEPVEWLTLARTLAALPLDAFLAQIEGLPPAQRRSAMRARFRVDLLGFAAVCFPHVCTRPFNDYHRHTLGSEKVRWSERIARSLPPIRDVQAAPRGIAKSTSEQISCVHDVVYGLEGYTLVIGPGEQEGSEWSASLRLLMEQPSDVFRLLYGEIETTRGAEAWSARAPGQPWSGFRFASSRSQIRGTRFGVVRPTKVIFDDYDNRSRVRNPRLRSEDADFITKDALKVGPPGGTGTIFRLRGTVHHAQSQIAHMLARRAPHRGWSGRRWQGVISWPARTDLWDACGRIYTNLTLRPSPAQAEALSAERPDLDDDQIVELHRERLALAFYEANRAAMDEGAEVLDPVALPIFRVYVAIWTEGRASVLSEIQNEPIDPSTQVFDRSRLGRCTLFKRNGETWFRSAHGKEHRVRDCALRMRWDPVPGQTDAGDFAAIGVIARDPDGYRYLLAAWMERASASAQLGTAWALAEQFAAPGRSVECVYESNGFDVGDSYTRQRAERRAAGQFDRLVLLSERQTRNKEERIGALEVPLSNQWLQIADSIPEACVAQLEAWRPDGSADHDDFPDMLAAADADIGHAATGWVGDPGRRMV